MRYVSLGVAVVGMAASAVYVPGASGAVRVQGAASSDRTRIADMPDVIRRFGQDEASVRRFHDLEWSEESLDRRARGYREATERLGRVDFEALDQDARIDYLLLRNRVRAAQSDLALERRRLEEIDELLPFREMILGLESSRRAMEAVDAEAAAASLGEIPKMVERIRERITRGRRGEAGATSDGTPTEEAFFDESGEQEKEEEKGGDGAEDGADGAPIALLPVTANRAAGAVGDLRGALREWFGYYDGYQPEFSWWVRRPYEEASESLEGYAKFLREEIAGLKGKDEDPLIGDPIGREALLESLATEMVAYDPEELVALAEREFAWCEARMLEASRELGFGEGWREALDHVKSKHVAPGEQDDLVTEQSREAIRFLKERDLVTIPPLCEETWRLRMLSPEAQRTLPFAAYGGQVMLVAYPTDAMKHDDKLMSMRGNNVHFSRIVTPHELIPGHHLQGYMAAREREYRRMFSTPFFVEGWAVYWEMTLWDHGYPETAEDRIGMLFWRMHRCARIIVSLRFHLGQMTPAEMIEFLVDRVGHERHGATSEVRRYIGGGYGPLYQCGYMVGAMQLRALRADVVGGGAGGMSEREFHDALLTYGAIPVELIRAGMTGAGLAREGEAGWRFEGEAGAEP